MESVDFWTHLLGRNADCDRNIQRYVKLLEQKHVLSLLSLVLILALSLYPISFFVGSDSLYRESVEIPKDLKYSASIGLNARQLMIIPQPNLERDTKGDEVVAESCPNIGETFALYSACDAALHSPSVRQRNEPGRNDHPKMEKYIDWSKILIVALLLISMPLICLALMTLSVFVDDCSRILNYRYVLHILAL